MKVIPKRAAALCTAALLLAPLSAQALTNVTPWAETELAAAEKAGLIPAFFEELDAAAPITRAEFCAVALAAYGAVTDTEVYIANVPVFTDCYDPNVSTAYLLGLASGRANGTFDPDATITRQELCVMLGNVARAAGLETDIPTSEALAAFPDSANTAAWAMQDVFTMVEGAVMSGVTVGSETLLEPTGTASRQQAVILANRFVSAYAKPSAPRKPRITSRSLRKIRAMSSIRCSNSPSPRPKSTIWSSARTAPILRPRKRPAMASPRLRFRFGV